VKKKLAGGDAVNITGSGNGGKQQKRLLMMDSLQGMLTRSALAKPLISHPLAKGEL